MKYKFTDNTNTVVADGNGWSGLLTAPEVQEWIEQGNTPEPADPPSDADFRAQIDQIERETLMNRAVREFMLAQAEQLAASAGYTQEQLYAVNVGYRKVKDIDNQIAALRAQIGAA